jgi:hypothetical protein
MPGFHASHHRQVVAETQMRLVSVPEGLSVTASLQYTTRDPYALSVVFAAEGCSPVVWVFARDLLLSGVTRPSGEGDVHVFPAGDSVVLDLASPDGTARLVAGASDIIAFVDDILTVVPLGHESRFIDIDAELDLLCRESFAEWGDA